MMLLRTRFVLTVSASESMSDMTAKQRPLDSSVWCFGSRAARNYRLIFEGEDLFGRT